MNWDETVNWDETPDFSMCEHHECRCYAAAKIAATGRTAEAVAVHNEKVRCMKPQLEKGWTG